MNYFLTLVVILIVSSVRATKILNGTDVSSGCTISKFSDVKNVVNTCSNIIVHDLAVPAGQTLELDLKSGTSLKFSGTTTFGSGVYWEGPLIRIRGNNIHVTGEAGSKLDGQGAHYWDGKGDGGKKKPKFFKIESTVGSAFTHITLLNCPHQCVSIQNAKQVKISDWTIDVSAGDKNNLAHNTDGFDISDSDTVTFDHCVVTNQDDCVAINSGRNLHFSQMTCAGGHGLSFSIGLNKVDASQNYAENITFQDSHIMRSRNAIHIKTHADGAKGYIKDVTYSNIHISGITHYGINVQQDYGSGKLNNNIKISGLTIKQVTGSMTSNNSMAVYVLCGSNSCSNFNWSGVSISGAHKKSTCNYAPKGYQCSKSEIFY